MPTPVADFTGAPLRGPATLSVVFADASTNVPTSWLWEKNPGTGFVNFAGTPTNQNPTESFAKGTWTVRLTATNANGSDTKTYTDLVTATDAAAGITGGGGGGLPVSRAAARRAALRWRSRWARPR